MISNDSDLARPIEIASAKLRGGVTVFNPHPGKTAWRLQKVSTEYRQIRERTLAAALFSDTLEDAKGQFRKPPSW